LFQHLQMQKMLRGSTLSSPPCIIVPGAHYYSLLQWVLLHCCCCWCKRPSWFLKMTQSCTNLSCHQGAPENCNATHHPLCAAIVIQGKWARVIWQPNSLTICPCISLSWFHVRQACKITQSWHHVHIIVLCETQFYHI